MKGILPSAVLVACGSVGGFWGWASEVAFVVAGGPMVSVGAMDMEVRTKGIWGVAIIALGSGTVGCYLGQLYSGSVDLLAREMGPFMGARSSGEGLGIEWSHHVLREQVARLLKGRGDVILLRVAGL